MTMLAPFDHPKVSPPTDKPGSDAARPRVADWLGLAAAPTFAIMALLTAMTGPADMLCSPMEHVSPSLSGMVPMYLLMSAFHLAPWLRMYSRGGAVGTNVMRYRR
jgi:hypothetical protein